MCKKLLCIEKYIEWYLVCQKFVMSCSIHPWKTSTLEFPKTNYVTKNFDTSKVHKDKIKLFQTVRFVLVSYLKSNHFRMTRGLENGYRIVISVWTISLRLLAFLRPWYVLQFTKPFHGSLNQAHSSLHRSVLLFDSISQNVCVREQLIMQTFVIIWVSDFKGQIYMSPWPCKVFCYALLSPHELHKVKSNLFV